MTEFVYPGDTIGESADLDTTIERRIDATWASGRRYSFTFYDRRNARLFLKNSLLTAEMVDAGLYGCATCTSRSEDFDNLCTAYHKLVLRVILFRH